MGAILILLLLAAFVAALAALAWAGLSVLVWLIAFTSPLGHRVQMERIRGRTILAMQRQPRQVLDDYEAQTRKMIAAARTARRSQRDLRP